MKRFAVCLKSGLVRSPVGETLADDAGRQGLRAGIVVDAESGAVVVAEIELSQITVQMLRKRPLEPTLRRGL